jgi:GTP1/Obg family GTP-binding protein
MEITIPPGKAFQLYCENQTVVNKVKHHRRELRRTVNQHGYPEVDIELQLIQELHHLKKEKGCLITLGFVQSHQDKEEQIYDMSLKEHLNVLADELTHTAWSLPRQKTYHPFPDNHVNVIINDRWFRSNYPRVVSGAYHSLALW